MVQQRGSKLRGVVGSGGVVVAIVGVYFGLLFSLGGYPSWDRLGVPTRGDPMFFDLRSVTTGWECTRRGISVLAMNPCDPARRPANYPRVWLLPAYVGLGEGSTLTLGFIIAVLFFAAAVLVLPARAAAGDAVVYALALCSPAVMLGIARANVDLLLFVLLAVGFCWHRRGRPPLLSSLLILAVAVLKLFPILAAPALLRERSRAAVVAFVLVLASFAVYVLLTLSDIRTIYRVVPQQDGYTYGVHLLGGWLASGPTGLSGSAWDGLLIALAGVIAILLRPMLSPRLLPARASDAEARDLALFIAGAGVYLGTYALARNFDYRLVFLLLCLPQLLRWLHRRSGLAVVALATLFATLWLGTPWVGIPALHNLLQRWQDTIAHHTAFRTRPLLPEALPQYVLFVTLTAAVAATLTPLANRFASANSLRVGGPGRPFCSERGTSGIGS